MYVVAFYYTVTTISTVGYGDISGTNSIERCISIILMISGVFFFSYSSGTLTNIISNREAHNQKLQEKTLVLNRIYQQYHLPTELYYQVKNVIAHDTNKSQEIVDFVEELPITLKHKINQHIYKSTYQKIVFFKGKDLNFITWICPMLKSHLFQQECQIYYETDPADSIFFLVKGAAGFVIPFRRNIVYIEVDTGDEIGQEDFLEFSHENHMDFLEIIEGSSKVKRQFTVQALVDCELLALTTESMNKMAREFYHIFEQMFEQSEVKLRRMRLQQLKAIR
jgi:hypothetical protein